MVIPPSLMVLFFVEDLSPHQGCCCGDKADGGGARRHRGERGGCRPKFGWKMMSQKKHI